MNINKPEGFTLVELLVAIVVAGILGGIAATNLTMFNASSNLVKFERAKEENRSAGLGLLEYAKAENKGRLPQPFTDAPESLNSVVADPDDTTITGYLLSEGLSQDLWNSNGYAGKRIRAYQMVTQTVEIPFFTTGGETVTVTYDTGVVYQTNCLANDESCNPAANGLPGESGILTTSNIHTWDVNGMDINPYMFSTFQIQRKLVDQSAEKLLSVRDALKRIFYYSMLSAPPASVDNFYPYPTGFGAPDHSGRTPASNEGCRDGWYELSSNNVNILSLINLTPKTYYGKTAFGGGIEYCRDYDPTDTNANTPPHGVALRINKQISNGMSPAATGNLILSF